MWLPQILFFLMKQLKKYFIYNVTYAEVYFIRYLLVQFYKFNMILEVDVMTKYTILNWTCPCQFVSLSVIGRVRSVTTLKINKT